MIASFAAILEAGAGERRVPPHPSDPRLRIGDRTDHHQRRPRARRRANRAQDTTTFPCSSPSRTTKSSPTDRKPPEGCSRSMKTTQSLALSLLVTVACSKEAPSDRLRVSGHVEATETRLAPEAGGRDPHADGEGRRSRAAGADRARRSTRETRAAGDRSREGGAGRRRSAAAARAGRRARRGHPAGAVADRHRARRKPPRHERSCRRPSRISNASTRCSRTTPDRASSGRCGDEARRGEGSRRRRRKAASRPPTRRWPSSAPERRPEEIDAARARVDAVVGADRVARKRA